VFKEDKNFSISLIHDKTVKREYSHYRSHSTVTVKHSDGKLLGSMKLSLMDREIMPGLSKAKMVIVPSIVWDMPYNLTDEQKQHIYQTMIKFVQQETEATMIVYEPVKINGVLIDDVLIISRAHYICNFVVYKKWYRSSDRPTDNHVYCWHNPRKEKDDIRHREMMMRINGTIFYEIKQAFTTDIEEDTWIVKESVIK